MEQQELDKIKSKAIREAAGTFDLDEIERLRVFYLGKKGVLSLKMKTLSALPPEKRPAAGAALNEAKQSVENALSEKRAAILGRVMAEKLGKETFDITLPGKRSDVGSLHPVVSITEELIDIFTSLGFVVEEGPEVETDEFNFKKLNFPDDHPARDMQDTFYLQNGHRLLRTHTSPVQIHAMLKRSPPLSVIAPGRVYRCDSDITHSPVFHQIEGFHIDRNVNMGQLKGTLELFVHKLYGRSTEIRLRPSFFPFTEPSMELDISCVICGGAGCRVCSGSGWIEILGAGMIDPNVLCGVGIDPEKWTGFAFGLGIERIAMLKYGIDDIRLLFENDTRFLAQF